MVKRLGQTGDLFPEAPQEDRSGHVRPGPFATVALDLPVRREFTYLVPERWAAILKQGVRVSVPFGSRSRLGIVVAVSDRSDLPTTKLRPIRAVLDEHPVVGSQLLELTRWIALEYACAWGEALHALLPTALRREGGIGRVAVVSLAREPDRAELAVIEQRFPKQWRMLRTLVELGSPIELVELTRQLKLSASPVRTLVRKGLVRIEYRARLDEPFAGPSPARKRPKSLNEDQAIAVAAISSALEAHSHRTFLLLGVTGSGKTEVYLRAIERCLSLRRGAIVLVPEIALTPQTVGWFRSRFGEVAVLHSRIGDAARRSVWERLRRGEVQVVVGARSALFAPVANLGVVVVDEEHEPSFKQGSVPRYHARDVAVERAKAASAVCILGSATPSLESWHRARSGDFELLQLPVRVGGGTTPSIEIVDMSHAPLANPAHGKGGRLFSRALSELIGGALGRGEQALLFLNRRGFTPVLWCAGCKQTLRCAHCDQALTFHRRIARAVCHICGEETPVPPACPTCTAPGLRYLGAGSERVEQELAAAFPEARVRRMDSDTMRRREDYEEVLTAFGRGELDVLVGTQMIAKGLDFPGVTAVGIVSADIALHLPDFRSAERTFQLVSQVAGRAGRGVRGGRIVVQTMYPDHPAIRCAAAHDYKGFAAAEDALRRELGYPPYGRLLRAVFEDRDEGCAATAARRAAESLRADAQGSGVILGPAPAPIALLRGRHRVHLLVKTSVDDRDGFARARDLLVEFASHLTRPKVAVDVDPVSML